MVAGLMSDCGEILRTFFGFGGSSPSSFDAFFGGGSSPSSVLFLDGLSGSLLFAGVVFFATDFAGSADFVGSALVDEPESASSLSRFRKGQPRRHALSVSAAPTAVTRLR